jgi:hypothetical protein
MELFLAMKYVLFSIFLSMFLYALASVSCVHVEYQLSCIIKCHDVSDNQNINIFYLILRQCLLNVLPV